MSNDRQLTKRGQRRRDELRTYATNRFAQDGFHSTSVSDIVDGLGVGKGVFYWYFESKNQLVREILREALRDLRIAQATAIGDIDDPLQGLEAGIRASLTWTANNPEIMKLVLFASSDPEFGSELRKGRDIVANDTAALLAEAMNRGRIAPGDPMVIAIAIRAIIDQIAHDLVPIGGTDSASRQEVEESVVRMCMRGLRG